MSLKILVLIFFPMAIFAQSSNYVEKTYYDEYPNTFSSGSANVQPFTNNAKRFNDWSIDVGGGAAFMLHSDLTSFYDDEINWGWNAYVGLNKQISHTFGLGLQYQMGKTNQRGKLPGIYGDLAGVADAWTEYQQISLIGDVNFSNLLRRVDNKSPYRWALHGYAGIGLQAFETLLIDKNASRWNDNPPRIPIMNDQELNIASFFYQGGLGLKYKISRLVDIEARSMYIISGDEEFDGGGEARGNEMVNDKNDAIEYNLINDNYSDNMWIFNLGLSFKIGKHQSHLVWHDPLQEFYGRIKTLNEKVVDTTVCNTGDGDNDGVCDDWDRELNTPAGARVDGAGVALDMDLDGTIDFYDNCVTVPGPIENQGCPTTPVVTNNYQTSITEVNKDFKVNEANRRVYFETK